MKRYTDQQRLLCAGFVDVEVVVEDGVAEALRVAVVTAVDVLWLQTEHDEDPLRRVARRELVDLLHERAEVRVVRQKLDLHTEFACV